MKKLYIFKWLIFFVAGSLSLTSCEKEMDRYYETPDWLKGNAWEVLEKKGNFTIFLQGIERTGYKDLVKGNSIITVMAPNDDAFKAYFTKKGVANLESIDKDELARVINYHLVYYSFDQEWQANYNPNGAIEGNIGQEGLFYKFRTKSSDPMSTVNDPIEGNVQRKIYHKDRYLPVFSGYLFKTKNIDAKTNYEYFYPNSKWDNTSLNQFNISNAAVTNYATVTDNGYVYEISTVIEPLETIYTELKNADSKYSIFRSCYDRFISFQYDADATTSFGKGDSLYVIYHTGLPKIASEWTYNGESASIPDYADLRTLSSDAYNLFAPSNDAMLNFFNDFWKDGAKYNSINDVNLLPIMYLLGNHSSSGGLVFPEEITTGQVKTKYGKPIIFDVNSTEKRQICVNGSLYGLESVIVPPVFKSVTGPAFKYPRFNMFLMMIDKGGVLSNLLSDQLSFKLFYPSDKTFTEYSAIAGRQFLYEDITPLKYGTQVINITGTGDIEWTPISTYYQSLIVSNHTAIKLMSTKGTQQVYKTLNDFQYLLVDGNNVSSSEIYNSGITPSKFIEINANASNGSCYEIADGFRALMPDFATFRARIIDPINCPAEYVGFKNIIQQSGVHLTEPSFNFLMGERFMAFIPTEQALKDNAIKIPSEQSELAEFVKNHFVNVSRSSITDYPFPGAGIAGTLKTFKTVNAISSSLTLIDDGSGLKIRDAKGNTVNVVSFFPRIYNDGVAYLIDGILEY